MRYVKRYNRIMRNHFVLYVKLDLKIATWIYVIRLIIHNHYINSVISNFTVPIV